MIEQPVTNENAPALYHISSLVVRCLPQRLETVMAAVAALPDVEIHGSDPRGRFVVLLESESDTKLIDTIRKIEEVAGVINTSMVYHHAEQVNSQEYS